MNCNNEYKIVNQSDFDTLIKVQRKEVQEKLDYYSSTKFISKKRKQELFEMIEKRGRGIRSYFRNKNKLD